MAAPLGARPTTITRPGPRGARRVSPPASPAPAAPEEQPGFVERFATALPDVVMDMTSAATGIGDEQAARARLAGDAQGFQQAIAQTAPGQAALRAEQGLSDVAEAGISAASRAFGSGEISRKIHADKAERERFLAEAEKGGQVEQWLGETGSRIFNSVVRSSTKMAAGGIATGGAAGVYSLIAGESFDGRMASAGERNLSGVAAVSDALDHATIETGLTFLMGQFGKRLGLDTLEETLSPAVRKAAADLAAKAIPKSLMAKLGRSGASSGLEWAEENLVDLATQGLELANGERRSIDWDRALEAGIAGGGSRASVSSVRAAKEVASRLRKIPKEKIAETVKGVAAAEVVAGKKPAGEGGGLGMQLARRFFNTATPEQLAAAGKHLNAKEFAELTGIKKSSQTFREAFRSTLELYQSVPKLAGTEHPSTAPPETPTPEPAAPASPAAVPTIDPDSAEAPQTPSPGVVEPTAENPERLTSAKRAMVDAARESRSLPEIPDAETRAWEEAKATARANGVPARALDLSNEVLANPRALSDIETAGVVVRMVEIENETEALAAGLTDETDASEIRTRAAQLARLETEYEVLTRAARTSGTEKGRGLAAQKMVLNSKFDLVSVMTRAKAAKGEALTPADRAKLTPLVEKEHRAAKRKDAFEKRQAKRDKEKVHREVTRLKGAVAQIRQRLGLDASTIDADMRGLSDDDRAALAAIGGKLKEAEKALDANPEIGEFLPGERVHHRPSELPVSDLDDAIARVLGRMTRAKKLSDADVERKKIEQLEKKLTDAQETLRKARAGEPIPPRDRRGDVMSEQRDKLHFELQQVRQEIRDAIDRHKPATVWTRAQGVSDFARGLLTSIDYSALGRQTKFAAWSHPIVAAKNIPKMLAASFDDQTAWRQEREILSRPNAPLYELGLTIHRRDAQLTDREETAASRLLQGKMSVTVGGKKIPIPNPVAGSQRAYIAMINHMRADVFDAMVKARGGKRELTREEYKQLGHLINVNTGRGGFAAAEKHMRTASLALFAPRFLLGRVQYAIGEPAWRSSNEIRKIVAEEYARTFVGAALWYGLYTAAWGDDERFSISFDPRSTDFGKIVLGNTRLDPLGGLAQVTRFVARLGSGQTVDKSGRVKDLTPRQKWDEVSRFARSKANPFVGHALNIATGEDLGRNPVNLTSLEGVKNATLGPFIPLSTRDIGKAMEDQGVPRGTALSILNLFGEGLMVYGVKK